MDMIFWGLAIGCSHDLLRLAIGCGYDLFVECFGCALCFLEACKNDRVVSLVVRHTAKNRARKLAVSLNLIVQIRHTYANWR